MGVRPRVERHFAFCALCRSGEPFDDHKNVEIWVRRHARQEHGMYLPYADDAQQTITVLYTAKSDDPSHTDPTGAALSLITWMQDRGHIT